MFLDLFRAETKKVHSQTHSTKLRVHWTIIPREIVQLPVLLLDDQLLISVERKETDERGLGYVAEPAREEKDHLHAFFHDGLV